MTNGGSAASVLRAAGVEREVVCWNDVLHEGPVPAVPPDALRNVRAKFLSDSEWTTYERVLRELTERDAAVAEAAAREEIVLWFEHDLYDQLQLLQVIDVLREHDFDWQRVALVCGGEYLGLSTPERLRERFPGRAPLSREAVELARSAWDAFRAPDPTALAVLLNTLDDGSGPLPFLAAALRRHLQQFPSTFNGLSRSEQQALEEIESGATSLRDAFARSQQREEAFFLGDTVFADYLKALSMGPEPLVTLRNGADVLDGEVKVTDKGVAVLRGEADRVRVIGIDRWFGGVHLNGHEAAWRWDGTTIQRRA